MVTESGQRFGEYLVENGVISQSQLNEALFLQGYRKKKIGRLLVELGVCSQELLNQSIHAFFGFRCPYSASELIKMRKAAAGISQYQDFLSSWESILVSETEKEIGIVCCSFNDLFLEKAERVFSKKISLWVINQEIFDLMAVEAGIKNNEKPDILLSLNLSDEDRLEANNPYAKLIKESIDEALLVGASDIHYEPYKNKYIVRLRVHGVLSDWKVLDAKYKDALTAQLKSITGMNLSVVGKPQDGRATFVSRKLDIRASSFPVINAGEKIVLRLQRQEEMLSLDDLGLSELTSEILRQSIQKKDGLILISGPTGSGKTTTLYALLAELDKYGKNISTLENPVEKKLDRISQADIKDYSSFKDFQKALMRQDPDVVLVGEVRDRESAELCMKLAASGHLVLSTIHANNAVGVIERLRRFGVDEFSIQSSLRLSIAQRLVQNLCKVCAIDANQQLIEKIEKSSNKKLSRSHKNSLKVKNLDGCDNCHKGIVGRQSIIEYLEKNEIATLISKPFGIKPKVGLADICFDLSIEGKISALEFLETL